MKQVTVIGHFGNDQNCSDGQTIKTRTIANELQRYYGSDEVITVDTHGSLRTFFKAFWIIRSAFRNSKNVIIMPAENGLRVFAPLCAAQKKRNQNVKLHYVVIGGWLTTFLERHKLLISSLCKFDGIYVETSTMKRGLEEVGLNNSIVMPNCKNLRILSEEELVYSEAEPLKLCTFSRVMRKKGIEDAVNAVKEINEQYGREVYALDIYGQVDNAESEWFDELEMSFPSFVKYKGVTRHNSSVDVIKAYFAMLFPTHFYTEGIPGTIIDAFAAGVPVISSKWESYSDILEDGITGIGYEFDNYEEFKKVLCFAADNPEKILSMKTKCILAAKKYTPEQVVKALL